jgi:predicted nucleotidyltransferase
LNPERAKTLKPFVVISERDILDLAERITREFSPEKILLFGSHAYGNPNEESDVDLLVVMPFDGRSRDKSLEVWKAIRPPFSVDLLVRRPEIRDSRIAGQGQSAV